MKRLIVNADDFGYSEEINNAIIECFKEGIVTSTTLITNFPGFKHAVSLAKKNPKLDLGIHLNLTENKFSNSYFNFLLGKFSKKEIEEELESQIQKVLDAGLKISHLDGHQHIHIFPKVFDIVVNLAKKYNIKYIRLPHEKTALNHVLLASLLNGQFIKKLILSTLSINKKRILDKNRLKTVNFYGLLSAKNITFRKMTTILKNIPDGVTELICHPGNKNYPDYLDRIKEKNILTHDYTKSLIKSLSIELTNFKSL